MLGVDEDSLTGRDAEEIGIELVDTLEESTAARDIQVSGERRRPIAMPESGLRLRRHLATFSRTRPGYSRPGIGTRSR